MGTQMAGHMDKVSGWTAERHLQRVIDTAADGYIAMDGRGRVTAWNDATTRIFGWSADEAIGCVLAELIVPPEYVAAHEAGLARYRDTGQGDILGQVVEIEGLRRDGTRLPIELTVWAVAEDEAASRKTGFHAFIRDATERKRAEAEVRRANADLTAFASGAAHDLRTPLMVIKGLSQLLESESSPQRRREFATRIESAVDRGLELIEDLLAYANVGQSPVVAQRVDLTELCREVSAEQLDLSDRVATIDVEQLPLVMGDRKLLTQLMSNLLANSLKYVPVARTPRVVVAQGTGAEPGFVVIRVSDNGDAIAEGNRDRIFEIFERGEFSSQVPGSGVGLAICKRVVQKHGGKIWIDPSAIAGTTFCVALPVAGA